ncbi:MAG: bifunctional pyr operon transcriptional regulator/uracil phosphoribosyltransferase PyrR [Acidobacteriota bacterium]
MKKSDPQRFQLKRQVLEADAMRRIVRRMAVEILERQPRLEELTLVGIRTRGLPLAHRLAAEIHKIEGFEVPIGALDITFYRDDLSMIGPQPEVKGSELDGPIDGRVIVLCDDVLYTGRTVRAALDELKDYGRPRAVRLAVLVDRGHRELPIEADVVGRSLQTTRSEVVEVGFSDVDGSDFVHLLERTDRGMPSEDS